MDSTTAAVPATAPTTGTAAARPLPVSSALSNSLTVWKRFLDRCLSTRLDPEEFESYLPQLYSKHPLPAAIIADFFLRPQPHNRESLDPRIPPYIGVLTRLGFVDAGAVLKALWRYSSSQEQLQASEQDGQKEMPGQDGANAHGENGGNKDKSTGKVKQSITWNNSYWAEEVMFYHVIKILMAGNALQTSRQVLGLLDVVCKWMRLFTAASNAFATEMLSNLENAGAVEPRRIEMETARSAFMPLLLRLIDNDAVLKAMSKPGARHARKELEDSIAGFVLTLQQAAPQVTTRLEIFRTQTLGSFDPVDKKKQAENSAVEDLLDSAVGLQNFEVQEIPISNTRAGMYIYINACLVGRPLVDDHTLISYLNIRYGGDNQASAIDLILVSFDVIENAISRNEGQRDAHLLKSFLINKVPLLLCQLCPPAFNTSSSEFCIQEALRQVDTSMFPTASLMFDESRNNNPYTESVREEFCNACALHGLIEKEHVDRILGERSMSDLSLEKLSKDKLVQDCLSDLQKIQGLVREVEKTDGNVGAVCLALVEVMRQLCANKDTVSLKLLCVQLAAKPLSLDILLLFEKLPVILEPLQQLLDNWVYDEDQGEYQPVYEEFGGILLLVLAFAYRYDMSLSEMALNNNSSSTARIISQAHLGRSLDELSEQESKHMGGWIHGLFDTEAGGLGDELMSSCMPQDFYMLVAPLFQNIVFAYDQGVLNDDTLKSGVEYLVDTFLLPCLVPAISYLCSYIKIDQREQKSIIKVLQLLLAPSSISGEASTMLGSVKNLVAKPLEQALRAYQKKDLQNQDIEPLLNAFKDHVPLSRRTGSADLNELESWISSSSTGLGGCVRHTTSNLVQWSLHAGMHSTPTAYTHRQVNAAVRLCGAKRVLVAILEEVRQQSAAGTANIVYDVATSLICAPNVTTAPDAPAPALLDMQQPPSAFPCRSAASLRESLHAMAEDCRKIQKQDPTLADIVVRLHRRVEAQLSLPPPQAMLPAANMDLTLNDGDAAALNDAMAAAAAANGGGVDPMQMDMSTLDAAGGLPDLGSLGDAGVGDLDGTGADDIFGGLDADNLDFGNWDGMGMDLS